MANVNFVREELITLFGELEAGDYFKFAGDLFIKIFEHKSLDYEKAVEEGLNPYDFKENAFCFSNDDFIFFDETDKVTPILPETIRIEVNEG